MLKPSTSTLTGSFLFGSRLLSCDLESPGAADAVLGQRAPGESECAITEEVFKSRTPEA